MFGEFSNAAVRLLYYAVVCGRYGSKVDKIGSKMDPNGSKMGLKWF